MRALTLTQPWATLVAIGAKTIETRSWGTDHSGPIAIHAAKGFPREARDVCQIAPFAEVLKAGGVGAIGDLPLGVVVAVAHLHTCFRFTEETERWLRSRSAHQRLPAHEVDFGDYTPGRYGFKFVRVQALAKPLACRGMLSLWHVPLEIERAIAEQLDGVPA